MPTEPLSLNIQIAYPRRAPGLMFAVTAAIMIAIAAGGLLSQLLAGNWASLSFLLYLLLFVGSYVALHRGLKRLMAAMKPVIELNDEEIIHFPTDTRIGWVNIVDLAQRRAAGRWIVAIRYVNEDDPERLESFDLPIGGLNISGQRLGRSIRQRFEAIDAAEDGDET